MAKIKVNWDVVGPKVKQLIDEGKLNKEQIRNEVGIGRTTLERYLKQNNLVCQVSGFFWKDHLQDLINYLQEGNSLKDASIKFNVSYDSIDLIVRRHNINYVNKFNNKYNYSSSPNHKIKYSLNELRIKSLSLFLKREPSQKEINTPYKKIFTKDYIYESLKKSEWDLTKASQDIFISISSLQKLCKEFNIDVKSEKQNYIKNKIFQSYIIKDQSILEIVESTGLSESSVRNMIKKYLGSYKDEIKRSLGEKLISSVLDDLCLNYTEQSFYRNVASGYRNYVKIDFELIYNNQLYWIEYNGEQHYKLDSFINLSNNTLGIEDFMLLLNRDRCVRSYANLNNIKFIEIPYTITSFSKLRNILNDIIIKGKSNEIDLSKYYDSIRSYNVNPIDK